VALWRYDTQYALPSPPGRPPYYWTSVYHWQQSDVVTPDAAVISQFERVSRQSVPPYVVWVGWRATAPDGTHHVPDAQPFVPGSAPFGGVPGPLSNIVRVEFWAAGVLAGYKRLRGAWRVSEMVSGGWSSALLDYLRDTWAPVVLANPVCSSSGVAFDAAVVRPEMYGWQLRHGTKRAARQVIVMS
jgi:hypothetical protein